MLGIHGLIPKEPVSHTSINTRAKNLLLLWWKRALAYNCPED